MKAKITKVEMYYNGNNGEKGEYGGSSGKPVRPAVITDACGHMQPTRRNPGGFVGIWDYSGSGQTKKSPTSKPGNGR
jgi:hypothetical protein